MSSMKTTVDLPDALANAAKALAHEHGTTLRELVVEGLRAEVERRATPRARIDFVFPTVDGEGIRTGVDPSQFRELAYDLPTE